MRRVGASAAFERIPRRLAPSRSTAFEASKTLLGSNAHRFAGDFLRFECVTGPLAGENPGEVRFVRCDCSTMTQTEMDERRLIRLVGVGPVCPAEFVNLRIGQCTADRRR